MSDTRLESLIPSAAATTAAAEEEDHHLSEGPVVTGTASDHPKPADDDDEHEHGPNSTVPTTTTTVPTSNATSPVPKATTVTTTKATTTQYKYDPDKITLRFLFANRDGLTVTVTCNPSDTIAEVKGVLISIWPKDVPNCDDGDDLRLICMGKGFLAPDSRTLQDCQIPIFKTHPTPVNVSVKPNPKGENPHNGAADSSSKHNNKRNATSQSTHHNNSNTAATTNHHTVNNNNNTTNSNSHTTTTSTNPRGTNTATSNPHTSSSPRPIETGQGCCVIS